MARQGPDRTGQGPKARTVHIEGIGPVLLERSARARRVVITIRPRGGVRVAVPARVSFDRALEFLDVKKAWVRRHLDKLEREESRRRALDGSRTVIDRQTAADKLKARLRHLAARYGFSYNRVSVRNQKTRWGSCSQHNNISLNLKLILLPPELMDYVLLHELVHTRVHNHSRRFWAELDKYVGDARAISRLVRQSGIDLL